MLSVNGTLALGGLERIGIFVVGSTLCRAVEMSILFNQASFPHKNSGKPMARS